MDVTSWTNGRGQEFKFVHFLDEGTLFHVAQPCSMDTESQIGALENYWINWAGPPKELYADPATGYTAERFLGKLQEYGIQMKVSARDSHWQLGRAEVHGSSLKRMLERMDKERPINDPENFRECLVQACIAKNACPGLRGIHRNKQFWESLGDFQHQSPQTRNRQVMHWRLGTLLRVTNSD